MTPDDDVTRLAQTEGTVLPENQPTRRLSNAAATPTSSGAATATGAPSTGWLSSSGDIDHGQFLPGSLLGGRYRVVGRLGRGGMGEVYRADDLKLGQPVALKFLPADVERDPARLTQLHTEVRMARQVSHPNVCRVYDIDEVDGRSFLSMEYVDGEDLSSLLRRIGRFSGERALEVARQICAGLAAAHERGVIHRDLKPANVMVDGAGRVRITDFGLAGASGESIRAGTPAYMAPEQLAGGEVTARSDLYALGLVLYELFTGRRAIEAKSLAELLRKREEAGIAPPSTLVTDLDISIDRAVLRCLERDPESRPMSALAVAAALPGGDPLAAALAAGETPSPDMVAAAGANEALRPLPALAALAMVLATLAATAVVSERVSVMGLAPVDTPVAVLVDRAQQLARSFGYTEPPADSAGGFTQSSDFVRHVTANPRQATRERLRSGRPALMLYWYRTSPRELIPTADNRRVSLTDPPYTISGMTSTLLDPQGRLVEFHAVPPQVEPNEPAPAAPPDWNRLFAAADLNPADFKPVTPAWTPRGHSDARAAWEGPLPGWGDERLRIEAAAYRGRPVYFQLVTAWTLPARMAAPAAGMSNVGRTVGTIVFIAVLLGAVLITRHNWKRGRGDLRGANRLSGIVLVVVFASRLISSTHAADINEELGTLFDALSNALFVSAMLWLLYLALEPYVRRFWPSTLVSWSRLVAGRLTDPLVGRDILIGAVFAAAIGLLNLAYVVLAPLLGYDALPPVMPRLSDLEGMREVISNLGIIAFNAPFNALWLIFGIVLLRLVLRKTWLVVAAGLLLFIVATSGSLLDEGPTWLRFAAQVCALALVLTLVLRFGLLATTSFFVSTLLISSAPLTLNPDRWYFATSAWILSIAAAIAIYGFYAARGGEPLFGRRLLD